MQYQADTKQAIDDSNSIRLDGILTSEGLVYPSLQIALNSSESVERRINAFHEFFGSVAQRFAGSNGTKLTVKGVQGQFNESQQFAPPEGQPRTWQTLLSHIACLHYRFDHPSEEGRIGRANIFKEKGYSRGDTVARIRKDAFAPVSVGAGTENKSLVEVYECPGLDRALDEKLLATARLSAFHEFFKAVAVRFANGNGMALSSRGIAGQFRQEQPFSSPEADMSSQWAYLLKELSYVHYLIDHNGQAEGSVRSEIFSLDGYARSDTIGRLRSELFGIEAAVEAKYQFPSLEPVFNVTLSVDERLASLRLFFLEVTAEFCEEGRKSFESTGIAGKFSSRQVFAAPGGEAHSWRHILRELSYLFYLSEHDGNAGGLTRAQIIREPGYSIKEIILRIQPEVSEAKMLSTAATEIQSEAFPGIFQFACLTRAFDKTLLTGERIEAYHEFFKEAAETFANGDGSKIRTRGISGQFTESQRFSAPNGDLRAWSTLIGDLSYLYYLQDNQGREKLASAREVLQQNGYRHSDVLSRVYRDVFGITYLRSDKERVIHTRRIVNSTIEELSREVGKEELSLIASRYGMPVIQIAFASAASLVKGAVDERVLRRLIDGEVLGLIENRRQKHELSASPCYEPESGLVPSLVENRPPSKDALRTLAGLLDRVSVQEATLSHLSRQQAVIGLSRLEEERLLNGWVERKLSFSDVWLDLQSEIEETSIPALKEALAIVARRVEKAEDLLDLWRKQFHSEPHLHQLLCVADALEMPGYAFAETMGAGKTRMAIFTYLACGTKNGLVIAPKAGLPTWMDELASVAIPLRIAVIGNQPLTNALAASAKCHHTVSQHSRIPRALLKVDEPVLILANKEYLRGRMGKEGPLSVGILINDEAHEESNFATEQTKLIYREPEHAPFVCERYLALSGTFLRNAHTDILPHLTVMAEVEGNDAINKRALEEGFKRKDLASVSRVASYIGAHFSTRKVEDAIGKKVEKTVHHFVIDPYNGTVLHPKFGLLALPNSYETQIALYEAKIASLEKGGIVEYAALEEIILSPKTATGDELASCKLDAAELILNLYAEDNQQVLVLADNIPALRAVQERLVGRGIAVSYVDGTVVDTERKQLRREEVARYRSGQNLIFLATHGTMATSENLPETDVVLNLTLPWTAAEFDQGGGRGLRPADTQSPNALAVEVACLMFQHSASLDEAVWKLIENKRWLDELYIRGNLSPLLLERLQNLQEVMFRGLKGPGELKEVVSHRTETPLQLLRFSIGRLWRELSGMSGEEIIVEWAGIAELYHEVVEQASSFFLYSAFLDRMREEYWTQGTVALLDAGSGPSVGQRAYLRMRELFHEVGIRIDFTELDSEDMLALGLQSGEKIVGDFRKIATLIPCSMNHAHFNFSFQYAAEPAQVIGDCYNGLVDGSLLTILLPPSFSVGEKFFEGLTDQGFRPLSDQNTRLHSLVGEKEYLALKETLGEELAYRVSRSVRREALLIIARKDENLPRKTVSDNTYILNRKTTIQKDEALELLEREEPRSPPAIPPEITISGIIASMPRAISRDIRVDQVDPMQKLDAIERLLRKLPHSKRLRTAQPREKERLERAAHNTARKISVLFADVSANPESLNAEQQERLRIISSMLQSGGLLS